MTCVVTQRPLSHRSNSCRSVQAADHSALTFGVCNRTADRRLLYKSLLTVVRSAGVNRKSCTRYLRGVAEECITPS